MRWWAVVLVIVAACAPDAPTFQPSSAGGSGGQSGVGGTSAGQSGQGGTAPDCGNGIIEEGEQCDDKNNTPGDGCDAVCRTECSGGALRDPVTGHCYFLVMERKTWYEARSICQSLAKDGDLLILNDLEKEKRFRALIDPKSKFILSSWIGARGNKGMWTWVDDSPWSLPLDGELWIQGEPNDAIGCIARFFNDQILDHNCITKHPFWCETSGGITLTCGDGHVTYPETCDSGPGCGSSCVLCDGSRVGSPLTGGCYRQYSTPLSWYSAKQACSKEGGRLVSINSDYEQRFLEQFLNGQQTWLGASQKFNANEKESDPKQNWIWEDDSPWGDFLLWAPNEPNDSGDGVEGIKEDCLEYGFHGLLWNDNICTEKHQYICEWPPFWNPP